MGTKYSSQSATGYNSSPPPDDGTTVAANKITWSTIKTKLPDPVKNLADAMNSALVTALDESMTTTSVNYTTLTSDRKKPIICTSAVTISLCDAATAGTDYSVTVINASTGNVSVTPVTGSDTLDGAAGGTATLGPGDSATFGTNTSPNGYRTISDRRGGLPRGNISGLTLSTAGGSGTMSIAAGKARDSTDAVDMALTSSISKTTSSWAVGTGNGGLDTGAIATGTWYHFYEIRRADTGVVDVLFSLSASAPTMPTNYTHKRRIGSGLTDGSSHWTAFIQDGDLFQWSTPVNEINITNPGTSAITKTLAATPTGVNVVGLFSAFLVTDAGGAATVFFSDLATSDVAPSSTNGGFLSAPASSQTAGQIQVRTNTSAQIRYRASASFAGTTVTLNTIGWTDSRGKNA